MGQELAGQRALVTAGAAGIGRTIARTFAAAGARVFVCDVDDAALAAFRAENPTMGATRADVSDLRQVDALFAEAVASLGGLDILVNNAGVAGPTAAVETVSPADWERTIAINLNGMFYVTRKAVPLLKAAGGGSIVNLSSVAGRLGFPLRTPYAASKWAVVGFTKSLAMEVGPAKIRVNCIQPGIVEGPRIDRVIDAKARALNLSFDEMKERLVASTSLRSTVTADDIAAMALFVCSAAGAKVTGQALSVCADVQVLT
jgi:NAD(P)-dependent dehydrogenase (short-subunit alcohol dehydrogenase family)